MRSRIIRAEFFTDENILGLSMAARMFFIGLWCVADRAGRFEWKPKQLKVQIFPGDNIEVEPLLNELCICKLVHAYAFECKHFGVITNFLKHQSINRNEAQSKIPQPPEITDCTCMHVNDCASVQTDKVEVEVEEEVEVEVITPPPPLPLPASLDNPTCRAAIEKWLAYKKERGEKYKPLGLKALLDKWAKNPNALPAAVEHCTSSNYSGLFPAPNVTSISQQRRPTGSDLILAQTLQLMAEEK